MSIKSKKVRSCRNCGCTQGRACQEGCHWVDHDLCSQCVGSIVILTEDEVFELYNSLYGTGMNLAKLLRQRIAASDAPQPIASRLASVKKLTAIFRSKMNDY
jgi:hypothetical protein